MAGLGVDVVGFGFGVGAVRSSYREEFGSKISSKAILTPILVCRHDI